MKPFSYYRHPGDLSVTSKDYRGNTGVTSIRKLESLTSRDSGDSLPLLPVLPLEKQSLHFTEAVPGAEDDVMNQTTNGDLLTRKMTGKSNASISITGEPFDDSLAVTSNNLQWWLAQIKQCATKQDVFSLLDQFRSHPWTDEERALMSRAYVQPIAQLSGK